MLFLALAAAMRASVSEVPEETPVLPEPVKAQGEAWNCRNQVEVWCAADGCAARPPDEFTPMDVSVASSGDVSICAYTGCWQGLADVARTNGRTLWTAEVLKFSTQPGAEGTAATVLIIEKDGVGFVRVGGLATPVLCEHRSMNHVDTGG